MFKATFIEIGGPQAWHKGVTAEAISEGLGKGLEVFHRRHQKEKFTEHGARRYHFEQRSKKYEERKQQAKGHRKPMVWSGTLRRDILRRVDITTRKRRAEAVGTWRGRALNFSGKSGKSGGRGKRRANRKKYPDMRGEVEKMIKRDTDAIVKIAAIVAVKFLDKIKTKKVTKL